MLKMIRTDRPGNHSDLKIEGRVIGPWVDEVRRVSGEILATGARLTIDLSEVSFVNREGVELFRELRGHHRVIVTSSGFVAEQLKSCERWGEGDDRAASS